MRKGFGSWNMVVVAVIAPLLAPVAWAQGTFTLTPMNAGILFPYQRFRVNTDTPGSVTITDTTNPIAYGRIWITAPPTITTTSGL